MYIRCLGCMVHQVLKPAAVDAGQRMMHRDRAGASQSSARRQSAVSVYCRYLDGNGMLRNRMLTRLLLQVLGSRCSTLYLFTSEQHSDYTQEGPGDRQPRPEPWQHTEPSRSHPACMRHQQMGCSRLLRG